MYIFNFRRYIYLIPFIGSLFLHITFCQKEKPLSYHKTEQVTKEQDQVDQKEKSQLDIRSKEKKQATKKSDNDEATSKNSQLKESKQSDKTKKSLSPKKKSTTKTKNKKEPAPVKVNEAEMSIKYYLNVFAQNEDWETQMFFKTLQNPKFFDVFNKLLGLTDSLKKYPFLLDKSSVEASRLFRGEFSNPRHNVVNEFFKLLKFKEKDVVSKYLLTLLCTAANNDRVRIKRNQKLIKAFKNNPGATLAIKGLHEAIDHRVFKKAIMFFSRDFIPFPETQAIDSLTNFAKDPLIGFLIHLRLLDPEILQKNSISIGVHQGLTVFVHFMEAFAEVDNYGELIKQIGKTGQKLIYLLTFRKFPQLNPTGRTLLMMPSPDKRLPYRIFNIFVKRFNALWSFITGGGGKLYDILTGGSDSNNMFYNPTTNRVEGKYLDIFSVLTSWFAWPYHCIIYTTKAITRFFLIFKETKDLMTSWQQVTIVLQKLLGNMAKSYEFLVKVAGIIEADPKLKKEINGPILAKIKALVNCKEIETIMKEIQKMSLKPPTLPQVLWGKREIAGCFSIYHKLDKLPLELSKILSEGTIALMALLVYVQLGAHVHMSEKDMVQDKICIVDMKEKENKTSIFSFKNLYTPLVKGKKVCNDINLSPSEKLRFLTGPNGSGKSSRIHSITMAPFLNSAIGISCSSEGSSLFIDKVIVLGGSSGDMAEGNSSFMQNVEMMNKILQKTEELSKENKRVLIVADEFMGGKTVHAESLAIQYYFLKKLAERGVIVVAATHDIELFDIAKKDGYHDFSHYTTEYNQQTGKFTYKIKKGTMSKPASMYVLQNMGYPKELLKKSINLLKKDPTYPFKDFLPGEKSKKGIINLCVDIFIILFFMISAGFIIYRNRRSKSSSKEEQAISS